MRLTHAFIGALVAATCSSWPSAASAIYITNFPSYQAICWRPGDHSHPVRLGVSGLAGGVAGAETTACLGEYEKPGAEELA